MFFLFRNVSAGHRFFRLTRAVVRSNGPLAGRTPLAPPRPDVSAARGVRSLSRVGTGLSGDVPFSRLVGSRAAVTCRQRSRQCSTVAGRDVLDDGVEEFNLGLSYRNGTDGRAQDSQQALKHFFIAAEKGHAEAMFYIGQLYLIQDDENDDEVDFEDEYEMVLDPDYNKFLLTSKAEAQKIRDGSARDSPEETLGDVLEQGKHKDAAGRAELKRLKKEARNRLRLKRARERSQGGLKEVGVETVSAEDIKSNVEHALGWFELSASRGYVPAMVQYADVLLVQRDEDGGPAALESYQKALALCEGSAAAAEVRFNIGRLYFEGLAGISEDQERGYKWIKEGADLGNKSALFWIGHSYHQGTANQAVNHGKALQYIKKAAQPLPGAAGAEDPLFPSHSGALYYLGLMYLNGDGVELDTPKAIDYVREAAELGNEDALFMMGELHCKGGFGVDIDYDKAKDYFGDAGKLGHADSLCALGAMLYQGLGDEPNPRGAFEVYQVASELNSVDAWRSLGYMYMHGDGVEKNKAAARLFLDLVRKCEALEENK